MHCIGLSCHMRRRLLESPLGSDAGRAGGRAVDSPHSVAALLVMLSWFVCQSCTQLLYIIGFACWRSSLLAYFCVSPQPGPEAFSTLLHMPHLKHQCQPERGACPDGRNNPRTLYYRRRDSCLVLRDAPRRLLRCRSLRGQPRWLPFGNTNRWCPAR